MRNAVNWDPLYAAAARCLAGLAKSSRNETADPEGLGSPSAEQPEAPFSRIVGFRPEPGEADGTGIALLDSRRSPAVHSMRPAKPPK